MVRFRSIVVVSFILFMAAGCTANLSAVSSQSKLQPTSLAATFKVQSQAHLSLPDGFGVDDPLANSTWREVGATTYGRAFAPTDKMLMTNYSGLGPCYRYTAYLVVNQGKAVGIYLPTESSFIAATPVGTISLIEVHP